MRLSAEANAALMHRPWPGNVRELENLIERTLVNSCDPTIDESGDPLRGDRLAEKTRESGSSQRSSAIVGIVKRAARELGLSRVTLWRRMSRYNLSS